MTNPVSYVASGSMDKSSPSRSREYQRLTVGNDDGVLVVGGRPAIGGAYGPAVFLHQRIASAEGDDGLDGDNQSLRKHLVGSGVVVIWHARLFVDRAADSVSA